MQELTSIIFWDESTERLARDAVRLPRRLGGFGIPCIDILGRIVALRALMNILEYVEAPARSLALYFMGPARRLLVPHLTGNLFPSAVVTPAFCKALTNLHKELLALDPAGNVRETQPARICEQLIVKRATLRV